MTKRITKIENKPVVTKKIKVAAYCRVSTDMAEQHESLEAQKSHYMQYINEHPDWSLVDIYYDEGYSGTKKEKRSALQKLLQDCDDGKVDLIVTKSISRFARNTTDCLELVRELCGKGINIFFERERINTGDMEGEFMLTNLSSLDEQESVSISQNAKWSLKKKFADVHFRQEKTRL